MKEKIGSKLRLLLCFGVIVFISLAAPRTAEAHYVGMGSHEEGVVYDGTNPWDGTFVGWFTHDKEVGSKATGMWYTKGYYVTTYPLYDYTIPAGALQVTDISTDGLDSYPCTNGYVDTTHLFDKYKTITWGARSGATFDDNGVMTVYAQPVIGTKTKKKTGWSDDGVTLTSLSAWVNAKRWANTSTFSNHYNKPLKIIYAPTNPSECTLVKYQALGNGEGYVEGAKLRDDASYSYNIGSVHSYASTGLVSYFDATIDGETRRFVLAGVKVEKPADCAVGTSGRLAVSTEENNLVMPSGSYATVDSSLSDAGAIPGSGWNFKKDYSSVHSHINGCNFRVSTSTTITYLYAEVKTVCKLYTAMRFDGYNTFKVLNADNPFKVDAGKTFKYSGEKSLVPAMTSYKGYVWELVQASFYKKGANILNVPTVYAPNNSWGGSGSADFRAANIMGNVVDYNSWRQRFDENNKVEITTSAESPSDYVYAGRYQITAPQIELSYYKDSKGRYHLFSYTSCGATIDPNQDLASQYRRNTWLDTGAKTKYSVKSILRKQQVNIDGNVEKKDMVLTQSYAYIANKVDSVKGYNGNVNCWTDSSLPINGSIEASTRFKAISSQEAYEVAIVNGKVTKRTTACTINKAPIIFVTVYEGGPILTVKSYYTTEKAEADNRKYYYETPVAGEFVFGSETLKRGCDVQYPIGTTALTVEQAASQDGVGNEYGSLFKTRADGTTVECLRTRYFATNSTNSVKSVKQLATGRVHQSDLYASCPLWATNWNGAVRFKHGVAAMVKLYEAIPVKGWWTVSYADLEDGDKSADDSVYSQYKNNYYRIGRPRLVEMNMLSNGDGITCSFLEHVIIADATEMINGDYTLVNVGYSKTAGAEKQHVNFTENGTNVDDYRDYSDGYVSDIVNGKKTYYCNYAEQHYALQNLSNLETKANDLSIVWMLDPYGATDRSQLNLDDNSISTWEQNNAKIDNTKTWVWGIYKPDKAISRAYILENVADNTYTIISDYEMEDLDVYTTEYSVSYEPYISYNGTVLKLDRVNYANFATTPDLDTDVSTVDKMTSITMEYNDDSTCKNNTNVLRVQKKLLHVAGIYRVYTGGEPNITDPEYTEKIISYRDTDEMLPGNNSWSLDVLGHSSKARFMTSITNDTEYSSDADYDTTIAIPTTEYLQTNSIVPKYLVDIDYLKTSTAVTYTIHCYKGLNAVQTITDAYGNTVKIYTGKFLTEDVPVLRTNYHYSLSGSTVWTPQDITAKNYALNESVNEQVTMFATNNRWDNADLGLTAGYNELDASFTYPDFTDNMDALKVCYGVTYQDVTSSIDDAVAAVEGDWNSDSSKSSRKDTAEGLVDPITATNQEVTFNNGEGNTEQLLKHTAPTLVVADPVDVAFAQNVEDGVFSSKNDNTKVELDKNVFQNDTTKLQIDAPKSNGLKKSQSAVHYTLAQSACNGIKYKDDGSTVSFCGGAVPDDSIVEYTSRIVENGFTDGATVNDVVIMTPVVTSFTISDESGWNQKITPGVGQSLILDRTFTLSVTAKGVNCNKPGYDYKDYSRYIGAVTVNGKKFNDIQVKFPFQVISVVGDGTYKNVPANKWFTVNLGATKFILPSWADEGDAQLIRVRTNAINARANDSSLYNMEYYANNNIDAFEQSSSDLTQEENDAVVWNYSSYNQQMVEVIGRVYGLGIIDIGDYPLWEDYFRTKGVLNGNRYNSGLNDKNGFILGTTSKFTFPTVSGSHPTVANEGYTKAGYTIRYELETVGNAYSADDYVSIKPTFYVVDADGTNRREVSVYYDEKISGQKQQLIKVGSTLDKTNKKYYSLASGDFGIDKGTLDSTAKLLNYNTTEDFTNNESAIYTFGNIMLNQNVRTFVGKSHKTAIADETYLNLWGLWNDVEDENKPSADKVERSVQNWYGIYYLPSSIHVTTASDDEVKAACAGGVTYNEDCWIKDGYLIVNFEIRTVDGGVYHLAYNAAGMNTADYTDGEDEIKLAGDCNMWSVEQFIKQKKSDNGVTFNFEDGDFLVYDLSATSNATDDYTSGGTH